MIKQKRHWADIVFVAGMCTLSINELYQEMAGAMHYPSVITSVFGVLGTALYFLRSQSFRRLTYIWIIFQVVLIDRTLLGSLNNGIEAPIWDPSQTWRYTLGLYLQGKESKVYICVNLVPFAYLALFRVVSTNSMVGQVLSFSQLKADGVYDSFFPLSATLLQRFKIKKEKHWMLAQLDTPIHIEENTYVYALVRRKNGETLRLGLKQQSVAFMLIKDIDLFKGNPEAYNDYVSVPWVNAT